MKQYGLIGFPLIHSFSPHYFLEKFKRENINARYDLFQLEKIEDFKDLIQQNDLAGLNVTVPYKESVISFLDELSNEARAIGAVNTIVFKQGKLIGYNTDAPAFEHVLQESGVVHGQSALVFGTGGASKAVTYVLQKLNIPYKLISRQKANHTLTYNQVDNSLASENLLWINTTPVGQFPDVNAQLPLPFHSLTKQHLCIDLIYNPEQTSFLAQAKQHGAKTVNGITMLHDQAEKAWNLWQS